MIGPTRVCSMVFLLLGAVLIAAPAVAQGPEDVGAGELGPPDGSLVEIPSPTVPMVVYDFDAMPAGPTTVGDIQAAFEPPAVLMDITNVTRTGTGGYNFQTAGGRALVAADAAGTLALIDPPAGVFQNADSFTIVFRGPATEFGFEIGDWGGPFTVECFDGAASVGSVEVSTSGGAIGHFVQSAVPFDSCVLTSLPSTVANWVIPSFQIPESAVPVELLIFDVE